MWRGPPRDAFPGVVPLGLVLVRNAEIAVAISHLEVYSAGFRLTVLTSTRGVIEIGGKSPVADRNGLTLELEYANGLRLQTMVLEPGLVPTGPLLRSLGHTADDRSASNYFWAAPLPPQGVLSIALQWLSRGISRTVSEIDADIVLAAAARSIPLWGA